MPLAEIAAFLAQPDAPLADLVCQIAALDRQIAQAAALRSARSLIRAKTSQRTSG